MTKEQQDKLRRSLYNVKFTTDAEDENPFVGICFNDLLDIIHDFPYSTPHWIPVEERLPDEGQEVFAWNGTFKESYKCIYHDGLFEDYLGELGKGAVTHWMPIVPPRKEE